MSIKWGLIRAGKTGFVILRDGEAVAMFEDIEGVAEAFAQRVLAEASSAAIAADMSTNENIVLCVWKHGPVEDGLAVGMHTSNASPAVMIEALTSAVAHMAWLTQTSFAEILHNILVCENLTPRIQEHVEDGLRNKGGH